MTKQGTYSLTILIFPSTVGVNEISQEIFKPITNIEIIKRSVGRLGTTSTKAGIQSKPEDLFMKMAHPSDTIMFGMEMNRSINPNTSFKRLPDRKRNIDSKIGSAV